MLQEFHCHQVGKYLLNNRWVFDAGDYPDITTTLFVDTAGLVM